MKIGKIFPKEVEFLSPHKAFKTRLFVLFKSGVEVDCGKVLPAPAAQRGPPQGPGNAAGPTWLTLALSVLVRNPQNVVCPFSTLPVLEDSPRNLYLKENTIGKY